MLMPKRVKRRKQQRGRMKGKANSGNKVAYGDYGLASLDSAWITSNQIEAARMWIDIFPHKPITKKPAETRMGSGKGSPEYWAAVVKPGRVMFEIAGVTEDAAKEALRLASHKLPVRCKIVKKDELEQEEVKAE